MQQVHERGTHICETCGITFKRIYELTVHRNKIHPTPNDRVTCKVCSKIYKNVFFYRRHKRLVHDMKEEDLKFKCGECGKKFISRHKLNLHQLAHNPNAVRFTCEYCNRGFRYSSGFLYHKRSMHTNERLYACPCCDLRFFDYPNSMKHIKSAHGSDLKPVRNQT